MAEKRYVGSGRKSEQYDIVNISVCLSDIAQSDINEYEGKKYLRLSVGARKQADEYGKTHSVWVNEYVPEEKSQTVVKETADLPF